MATTESDVGTWTLNCENCDKPFEIEITEVHEKISDYTHTFTCPNCNNKPRALAHSIRGRDLRS
jgi:transcription elongation factor Elf1